MNPIDRHLLLFVLAFVFFCSSSASAQQAARPDRGLMPNTSYSVSDIENINLKNGNVNLAIPLASLPLVAGGKLSWTITAHYNSKPWDIARVQRVAPTFGFQTYVVDVPQMPEAGAWRISGQYSLETRDIHADFDYSNPSPNDPEYSLMVNNSWYKVILRMPDGAEHELRPTDYSSYPGVNAFMKGYYKESPSTHGTMRYYSYDGSHLFASVSADNNWTVYMPDGTRIVQTTDGIQRIQDSNGNKIKIFSDANGTHYQDEQTGREIRYSYNPSANGGLGQGQAWYQTVGGVWQHVDLNFGFTSVQGKAYKVKDWDTSQCQRYALLNDDIYVIREIVLPQSEPNVTRKFTFTYNSDATVTVTEPLNFTCTSFQDYTRTTSKGWGSLSQMTMPSGAVVKYSYDIDLFHSVITADSIAGERLTQKKVTHDGTDDIWTYNIGLSSTSITNPDGSTVSEGRFSHNPWMNSGFGKSGLVYRTTQPFTKIERHWTDIVFDGANRASPDGSLDFNAVVDAEYTSITDVNNNPLRMSAKLFQYDYNGNVTQTTEYDWFDPALVSRDAQGVPTGVPAGATVLRVTANSYYNQASTASSANVYAKRSVSTAAPLILNAPKQTTIGPTVVQLSYDGQAYGVAPTAGNMTTKAVWDDLDSKWIITSNTYDLYGNVATATDGRGKVTRLFYEDATHALPTRVVIDPQNGTGTQTANIVYDLSTGLVTSQTDVNGQIMNIYYTNQLLGSVDPFGRPGITKSPTININGINHRRSVTTTYLDSARQIKLETDLNAENDKLLKTRTTMDMLGRPVLSESTEDGTNYTISARKAYLNMGQVTLTSSPMRSAAAPTDSWTRVTKDGIGRVKEVATFGGATQPGWTGTAGAFTGAVTTDYNANFTTVTDQAGKVRRSMVDALGRLLRVDEPDTSGNLGSTSLPVQKTEYEYDVLDNLKKVNQDTPQQTQQRTFTYDSLSRLRTAINPESGTVTYQYDDNGNLIVKTDARAVSAHYAYDSINRVTRRWYNGSNSTSQTTHNVPALPAGVGATDEVKFYYDSQSLPGGAPSYSRGSTVGRLVAQTYGSGSTGDYYAYDVLGRQNLKIQQTGSINYQLTAGYTLSGALSSLTYPSGHAISNTFDQAGRLTIFNGNLGDGTTRTYATGIVYSSLGGLLKEQFGTTTSVYHKLHYNSRAQLCDVRASNVNDEWGGELGAIANYYSTPWTQCSNGSDNNGNLLMSQTIINGSVYFEDRYSYDSLNRLTAVNEYLNGTTFSGKQEYDYDRWGNRTLKPTSTLGTYKEFTVNTANNRLGVPASQPPSITMSYDNAGNLINDTYTGAGNRTYDAENKITSAWGGNSQAQLYGYDASGQRIKRTVDGVTTWQVYGFGGELLAEYPANGAATSPQKEYGYRNGELLVTAEASSGGAPPPISGLIAHWKFDENSGTTTADSSGNGHTGTLTNGPTWTAGQVNAAVSFDGVNDQVVNNGIANLTNNFTVSFWAQPNTTHQIDSESTAGLGGTSGQKYAIWPVWHNNGHAGAGISVGTNGVSVYEHTDNYMPATLVYSGSLSGWTHVTVVYENKQPKLYLNGTLVRTGLTSPMSFVNINPLEIGGDVYGYYGGKLDDVRVYNRALSASEVSTLANGSITSQSYTAATDFSTTQGFHNWYYVDENNSLMTFDAVNNVWAGSEGAGQWLWASGGHPGAAHDVVRQWRASQSGSIQITGSVSDGDPGGGDGVVVTIKKGTQILWQQTIANGNTAGVSYNLTTTVVPGDQISFSINRNSNSMWDSTNFNPTINFSSGGGVAQVHWLVTDHLGTPRLILDQTGALANIKRHDYLPFGEELFAPIGGRTTAQGYAAGDNVRQQFTSKERDSETSLDYFNARYYASAQGRFTSPDPFGGSGFVSVPQSWNKYTYCLNRPFAFTDPSGQIWLTTDNQNFIWIEDDEYKKNQKRYKDYSVANGAVTNYQGSANCPQCANVSQGQWVQLNADGSVTPVADPTSYVYAEYTDQEVFVPTFIGGVLYPDLEGGPKNGSRTYNRGRNKRTERWYDNNGRCWVDIDYGDGEPVGDPHVHWWDWNVLPPGRSEGEAVPEGWDVFKWDDGSPGVNPNRPRQQMSPYGIPVYPMDVPTGVPFRPMVPLRPTVPLRPIFVY